jgi:hypothetical protein
MRIPGRGRSFRTSWLTSGLDHRPVIYPALGFDRRAPDTNMRREFTSIYAETKPFGSLRGPMGDRDLASTGTSRTHATSRVNEACKNTGVPKKKRNDPSRAAHLHTAEAEESRQRTRDRKKSEKQTRDKEKEEKEGINNQEWGGVYYPAPIYPDGTARKKPNRNGITRTRKGLQAQIDNGKRVCENKAMFRGLLANSFAMKRPATSTLPAPEFIRNRKRPLDRFIFPQTVFRSQPEESLEYFIRSQLLPDVDVRYAETAYQGNDSDDIAITWSGCMTYWTRDFDVAIKGKDIEFQLQVKRTNLAKKLHWCLGGEKSKYILLRYYPEEFHKKRRAFRSLRKSLLDFALRLVCNQLALKHGNAKDETVRPLFHISAVSAKAWKGRSKVADSTDLLDLFLFESKRFETYYWDFLKAVFPNEDKVILRARKIFAEKHASLQTDSHFVPTTRPVRFVPRSGVRYSRNWGAHNHTLDLVLRIVNLMSGGALQRK